MRNHLFVAIVVWQDGDVEDADEFRVFAGSRKEAETSAMERWRLTFGSKWPTCQPIGVQVSPGNKISGGFPVRR